jgi:hypothetical protein
MTAHAARWPRCDIIASLETGSVATTWEEQVDRVRRRARDDLRRYCDPHETPTNLDRIARALGAWVVPYDFSSLPDNSVIPSDLGDGVRLVCPDYTGSLFEVLERGRPYYYVVVNSSIPQVRQRFTVAHELGHLVLGHRFSGLGDRHRTFTAEKLANIYASELLAPTDRLWRQIRVYGQDIRFLARVNVVSLDVMNRRWMELPETTARMIDEEGMGQF